MIKKIVVGTDEDSFNVQMLTGLRRVNFVATGAYPLGQDLAKQVQTACGYAPAAYGGPLDLASAPAMATDAALGSFETRWACFASAD